MVRGPDATFERGEQLDVEVPARRPRWKTPDAAVVAAVPFELGARALSYEPRVGGAEQEALDVQADKLEVLCALASLGFWERRLVEWYAHLRFAPPETIARARARSRDGLVYELMRLRVVAGRGPWSSSRQVRAAHLAARSAVLRRLVACGVCAR